MALSTELSGAILAYMIGGASIITATDAFMGLLDTAPPGNLAAGGDVVSATKEFATSDWTGYTRTSVASGIFGAYVAGSGQLVNTAAAITWPTTQVGASLTVQGVFLSTIATVGSPGTVLRWTSPGTFNPVTISGAQTPRIPISGCIITER